MPKKQESLKKISGARFELLLERSGVSKAGAARQMGVYRSTIQRLCQKPEIAAHWGLAAKALKR